VESIAGAMGGRKSAKTGGGDCWLGGGFAGKKAFKEPHGRKRVGEDRSGAAPA